MTHTVPMQANVSSWLGDKPMYTVYSATHRYHVFDGQYSVARYRDGRSFNASLMHARYAGIRAQLDAAIAAIPVTKTSPAVAAVDAAVPAAVHADKWRIFFQCAGLRGDQQLDVDADDLAMAEAKADEYAAFHDLTGFRVLNIAPHDAHQYHAFRQA